MTENPYATPETAGAQAETPASPVDAVGIARYQRGIIGCVLAHMLVFAATLFLPFKYQAVVAFLSFGVTLAGTVFVVLLGFKVFHPILGVLLGLVALFPCIGLLALLLVNARATSRLRRCGVRVGLLGARQADLAAQGYLP